MRGPSVGRRCRRLAAPAAPATAAPAPAAPAPAAPAPAAPAAAAARRRQAAEARRHRAAPAPPPAPAFRQPLWRRPACAAPGVYLHPAPSRSARTGRAPKTGRGGGGRQRGGRCCRRRHEAAVHPHACRRRPATGTVARGGSPPRPPAARGARRGPMRRACYRGGHWGRGPRRPPRTLCTSYELSPRRGSTPR
jgi:translation initiation factor IF-2